MSKLTQEQIDAIRARLQHVPHTKPWKANSWSNQPHPDSGRIPYSDFVTEGSGPESIPMLTSKYTNEIGVRLESAYMMPEVAAFITNAPTDLAALLAHVAALDAELAASRDENAGEAIALLAGVWWECKHVPPGFKWSPSGWPEFRVTIQSADRAFSGEAATFAEAAALAWAAWKEAGV